MQMHLATNWVFLYFEDYYKVNKIRLISLIKVTSMVVFNKLQDLVHYFLKNNSAEIMLVNEMDYINHVVS